MAGGKIVAVDRRASLAIPQSVPALDCSGMTITAGFWNSHVHFFERKWANAATIPADELSRQLRDMSARFGFTSVFDLSSDWENTRRIRDRIESGEVPGPKIRSTGQGLLPSNPGIPPDAVLNFMGLMKTPLNEVAGDAQAAAAVKKLLDEGVDAIKLFASSPSKAALSESTMTAAVDLAHAAGKPVFVHPNTAADIASAVRAGVDIIGHTTPHSGHWDETLIAAMQERSVALTPTLTLWKYFLRHDRASMQERVVAAAAGQVRSWVDAGGAVLFGTDLGAVDYDPTDEYALMAEAGINFPQILASLTTAPAERFGETASIETGNPADLVVLRGDPSRDLRSLTDVQYTVRAGKIIYRAGQTAHAPC